MGQGTSHPPTTYDDMKWLRHLHSCLNQSPKELPHLSQRGITITLSSCLTKMSCKSAVFLANPRFRAGGGEGSEVGTTGNENPRGEAGNLGSGPGSGLWILEQVPLSF